MTTTNITEQFATAYARNAVPDMLKAIGTIKRYNRFVLLAALATSYLHQAHYLWTQGAGYFAYLVPLIFDAAMVSMLIIVRTPGITRDAKRGALIVFAGTALMSATVNFLAPGTWGLRCVFALVVVLVIGVELVAGRIRPDFAAIERQATELLTAARDIANRHAESPAPATVTIPEPAPATTPAADTAVTEPVTAPAASTSTPSPDAVDVDQADTIPARLISAARMVTVQHRQTSTHPITIDELATRLGTTPGIAARLLTTIDNPTPARINGHTPALGGVR